MIGTHQFETSRSIRVPACRKAPATLAERLQTAYALSQRSAEEARLRATIVAQFSATSEVRHETTSAQTNRHTLKSHVLRVPRRSLTSASASARATPDDSQRRRPSTSSVPTRRRSRSAASTRVPSNESPLDFTRLETAAHCIDVLRRPLNALLALHTRRNLVAEFYEASSVAVGIDSRLKQI